MRWFLKCHLCGGKALEFIEKPVENQIIRSTNVIHKNNLKPGDNMTCQVCDRTLWRGNLRPEYLIEEQENLFGI